MAYSEQTYTASGSTNTFSVPFPYYRANDVHVYVNGVEVDQDTLAFPTTGQVQLASTPAAGVLVRVRRITEKEELVSLFTVPSVYNPDNLNNVLKQLLYVVQEAFDSAFLVQEQFDGLLDSLNAAVSASQGAADDAEAARDATIALKDAVDAILAAVQNVRDDVFLAASSMDSEKFTLEWAEANYHPVAEPEYIRTAFRDSDTVPGSGGLYAKIYPPATSGDLVITRADSQLVGYKLTVERPIVAHYGAVNTLDDRDVWQAAISKLQAGDTLAFPAGLRGTLRNATGSGADVYAQRADAVANDKLRPLTCDKSGVTVVINGRLDFTSALGDGFHFTGDGVRFVGDGGTISNTSGVFHADNSIDPAVQWHPTLLRLGGDDCVVTGINFIDHPTIALWAEGSSVAAHHNTFEGGPLEHEVGEYTHQFYIQLGPLLGGGRGGSVSHNTFRSSSGGGAAYTAVFSTQDGSTIAFNHIYNMLEHGVYSYGADSVIIGNHVDDSLNRMLAGAIQNFAPGTLIEGNQLKGYNNYIALQEASNCIVTKNRGGGVSARTYYTTPVTSEIENLVISENIFKCGVQNWPIDIHLKQPFNKLHITGNITEGGGDDFGASRAALVVYVEDAVGARGRNLLVAENTISGGASWSMLFYNISSGLVAKNNLVDAWIGGVFNEAARMYNCDAIDFIDNHVRDGRETLVLTKILSATSASGNTNIRADNNTISRPKLSSSDPLVDLPTGARPVGNTVNGWPLSGSFTMPNAATYTITHDAVRAGAKITLLPDNGAAWTLQAGAQCVVLDAVSAGSFGVKTASGLVPGSSSATYQYRIEQ